VVVAPSVNLILVIAVSRTLVPDHTLALFAYIAGAVILLSWFLVGWVLRMCENALDAVDALREQDGREFERKTHELPKEIMWIVEKCRDIRDLALLPEKLRYDFFRHISHQIRSPLTIARLKVSAVANPRISPESVVPLVQDAVGAIDEVCDLVESIFLASTANIMSATEPGHVGGFCLFRDVAQAAVARTEAAARAKGVKVTFSDRDTQIPGFAVYMVTALSHVLDNAIRYSPPKGDIQIGTSADRGDVRIWVVDQGPGVPEIEHQRIFDPFVGQVGVTSVGEQVVGNKENRTESSGVTNLFTEHQGLGLSVAKSIVTAVGGSVTVQNIRNGGFRVEMIFPLDAKG
jgi:signal transduction histidine kinase